MQVLGIKNFKICLTGKKLGDFKNKFLIPQSLINLQTYSCLKQVLTKISTSVRTQSGPKKVCVEGGREIVLV